MKSKSKKSKLSARERGLAGLMTAQYGVKPTAPAAESTGRETIVSFRAAEAERDAAEQRRLQAESERPVREAEAQLTATLRELRQAQARTIFSQPSEHLAEVCETFPRDTIDGNTVSVDDIRRQILEAFTEFRLAAEESGVKFEQSALDKMNAVSRLNTTLNYLSPIVWRYLFDHLCEIGALNDRDVTLPAAPVVQAPAQPALQAQSESLDDTLSTRSSEHYESRKEISNAILRSMRSEAVVHYEQFAAQLLRDTGHDLTDAETSAICQWMLRNARTFTSQKEWHRAKLGCIKAGRLPDIRTQDEKLVDEIETSDLSRMSFSDKQNLKRRILELSQKQPV